MYYSSDVEAKWPPPAYVLLFGEGITFLEEGGRGPLRSWPWELQPGPVSSPRFLFPDFLRDNKLPFASHATAKSSFCHYAISVLMGCVPDPARTNDITC